MLSTRSQTWLILVLSDSKIFTMGHDAFEIKCFSGLRVPGVAQELKQRGVAEPGYDEI